MRKIRFVVFAIVFLGLGPSAHAQSPPVLAAPAEAAAITEESLAGMDFVVQMGPAPVPTYGEGSAEVEAIWFSRDNTVGSSGRLTDPRLSFGWAAAMGGSVSGKEWRRRFVNLGLHDIRDAQGQWYWQAEGRYCGEGGEDCTTVLSPVGSFTMVASPRVDVEVSTAEDLFGNFMGVWGRGKNTKPWIDLAVTCANRPCAGIATGSAYAKAIYGKRIPALGFSRAFTVTKEYETVRINLDRRFIDTNLGRYKKVAWSIAVSTTDLYGQVAQGNPTRITVRDNPLVRPSRDSKPVPPDPRYAAQDAVEAEAERLYDSRNVHEVYCRELTRQHWRCEFSGMTREDVSNGHTEGHSGSADAYRYGSDWDVRIFGYGVGRP